MQRFIILTKWCTYWIGCDMCFTESDTKCRGLSYPIHSLVDTKINRTPVFQKDMWMERLIYFCYSDDSAKIDRVNFGMHSCRGVCMSNLTVYL